MKKALVDVAVLLVFFTRPEQFKQVFEQVKKARPSKLFLYQDGPRDGRPDDVVKIQECRAIAESIDWECEVHKFYQEKNQGCDPSGFIAHTWAFSNVDKCIVLEDDVVPSVSFFSFCKELLDKYENDQRISIISGLNIEECSEVPYDYFFSSCTSIWGWASWKRVVEKWDPGYSVLEDPFNAKQIEDVVKQKGHMKNFMSMATAHAKSGKAHFESIMLLNQYLNSGLTIVPTKNMINNVGVTSDSTHFSGSIESLPKGYRRVFTMKRYDIVGQIKHPPYVIEYVPYKSNSYRIKAWGHPIVKIYRMVETIFYRIAKGDFSGVVKDVEEKINKVLQKRTY